MTPTWTSENEPTPQKLTIAGKLRALLRGVPLAVVIFGGLALMLLVRLIEKPLHGVARPWTPSITVFVCRTALRLMGVDVQSNGAPMTTPGAMVANHSSWIDIFALNAGGPLYFVSKAEVAGWPGIGWLARATGTVFVRRAKRDAGAQKAVFEDRLGAGHKLLFFPEGTSTDGRRVLAFKPTLFAALYSDQTPADLWVQPVTVVYHPPEGAEPRFYGWWGDMDFAPHLLQVLGQSPQGRIEVTWHKPIPVADQPDRKAMARATEAAVRSAHPFGTALEGPDPIGQDRG